MSADYDQEETRAALWAICMILGTDLFLLLIAALASAR